jgi:cytochrome c-type biogenesis protein CcmH
MQSVISRPVFSARSVSLWLICILLAVLAPLQLDLLYAQDATPIPITDDEVNAVAERMYCPSCQGVPLDVCGTQVCIEWRQEIRTQLQTGRTPDEIIANFVTLYGERIVGTPQDPTLRAFSLITPYVIAAFVLLIGLWTMIRWRRSQRVPMNDDLPQTKEKNFPPDDDDYRARIEQDLQ